MLKVAKLNLIVDSAISFICCDSWRIICEKSILSVGGSYRFKYLTELQLNTIRAIGNMDIELRAKAQDLILSKTREYKALQDQAQKDAEAEFERILDKFSGNERIMDIMITNAQKKLASVIDGTSQFLLGLNEDIQKMYLYIILYQSFTC